MSRREKKEKYEQKVYKLLDDHDKAFIVFADNVGSKQFMDIRAGLRPRSTVLMGKNTLMKKFISRYCQNNPGCPWEPLIGELVGNVGVVFTKEDMGAVKDKIGEYRVPAPARMGAVATVDVSLPAGPTGLDPSQTSFFQALGISTKINKGMIEIVSAQQVCTKGERVGGSEATLLAKLNIKPFEYGLEVMKVLENGSVYDAAALEITDDHLEASVSAAISNVAATCLQIGYPTIASLPHSVINGYKNVLAISLATEYTFPRAEKIKEILENPEAFAAMAAAAAAPTAGAGAGASEAAAAAPEEEESEEEEDFGMSLFD